ncbi:MAG: hypothetical protein IKM59_05010 [Oscillospiraceae bacterium]|nr:hypothetical protein [Oscillospiraceae bacterium]
MNCPKCGKEMEPGFLQSDMKVGITWVSKPVAFGLGWFKKDSVTVSAETTPGLSTVPTHICKTCKLFFGDYSSE